MEAAPSPVGVAATSSTPMEWPQAEQLLSPPGDLSIRLPSGPAPAWSRPAQGAGAVFLSLALLLLGWHAWNMQRGSCRPATLEADILDSPALDLNQADHAQLLQLPGVGEGLARRIETYRVEHHGFRAVDELRQVSGIGPKMLEKLRPFLYVEAAASDEEAESPPEPLRPVRMQVESEKKPLAVRTKKAALTERIDVNQATAGELQRLPGIGPTLAQRIVEARAKQAFRSVEDLRRVRGIGAKTLERLRPNITVGENVP
jgi:competence protein ComEA